MHPWQADVPAFVVVLHSSQVDLSHRSQLDSAIYDTGSPPCPKKCPLAVSERCRISASRICGLASRLATAATPAGRHSPQCLCPPAVAAVARLDTM